MGQVTIVIDKREYAISCGDGQEGHIVKLAQILDAKAKQLSSSLGAVNENMMLAMVGLLLADELQEIKSSGVVAPSTLDLSTYDSSIAAMIDRQTEKISKLIKDSR